ncbi:MAG: response regulator [Bacilli bacterium]|nr:response regulator [Bacilli bacterium]MBN2696722.1 response regulator [Bacilli bacterium]
MNDIKDQNIAIEPTGITGIHRIFQTDGFPGSPSMYALIRGKKITLIGMNSVFPWENVFSLITELEPSFSLEALIVTETDTTNINALARLTATLSKPIVYLNQDCLETLPKGFEGLTVRTIGECEYRLASDIEPELQFIPMPFVDKFNSFAVYDTKTRTLFSGRLMDSPLSGTSAQDLDELVKWHSLSLPSSDFLRPVINRLSLFEFDHVLTMSGRSYDRESARSLLDRLSKLDFHNTLVNLESRLVYSGKLNYQIFLNQALMQLRRLYSDQEIASVLENQNLPFDVETFKFTAAANDDVRVWEKVFELIYRKKGLDWLDALEPTVIKAESLFEIARPKIYSTNRKKSKQDVKQLTDKQKELERELATVKEQLDATADKLVRDGLTGCYNESFLRQFLIVEGTKRSVSDLAGIDPALIYLSIDNMLGINARYSKAVGDETLLNVAYILKQTMSKPELVFKRNGPGFVVYIENTVKEDLYQTASLIQTSVSRSQLFIEPVTVSLALVRFSEFIGQAEGEALIDAVLETGSERIKLVHLQGPNSLIDSASVIEKVVKGNILIADEEIQLKLLTNYFRKAGYQVFQARDGFEALDLAKSNRMDAMIIAKNIPKLDGLTLKSHLNESTFTMNALYLLTTFIKTPETIFRANRLGVNHVLQKPLIFAELLGLIQRETRQRGE